MHETPKCMGNQAHVQEMLVSHFPFLSLRYATKSIHRETDFKSFSLCGREVVFCLIVSLLVTDLSSQLRSMDCPPDDAESLPGSTSPSTPLVLSSQWLQSFGLLRGDSLLHPPIPTV